VRDRGQRAGGGAYRARLGGVGRGAKCAPERGERRAQLPADHLQHLARHPAPPFGIERQRRAPGQVLGQ